MNAKLTLAVLFALVSVSLCDLPAPSQELKEKYEGYKSTFYKRLLNAYSKVQSQTEPLANSEDPRVQFFKDTVEALQVKPEFQAAVKVLGNVASETAPLVDKARETILGLYEQYLRDYIGEPIDKSIQAVKPYLDQYMPAE